MMSLFKTICQLPQCVKSVRIWSYSGPHFPAFGLNTEWYSLSLCIQSECWKMRTRITPNTDTFYAVLRVTLTIMWQNLWFDKSIIIDKNSVLFSNISNKGTNFIQPLKKFAKQSQKIKQDWIEQQYFNIYFCVFFDYWYKSYIFVKHKLVY